MQHTADAIQHSDVSRDGNTVLIRSTKGSLLMLKDASLERIASQLAGTPVRVRLEATDRPNGPSMEAPAPVASENELRQRALSHPGVKRFQELFPGAQVRTVRNLDE
jgi:hypothetical protein